MPKFQKIINIKKQYYGNQARIIPSLKSFSGLMRTLDTSSFYCVDVRIGVRVVGVIKNIT